MLTELPEGSSQLPTAPANSGMTQRCGISLMECHIVSNRHDTSKSRKRHAVFDNWRNEKCSTTASV